MFRGNSCPKRRGRRLGKLEEPQQHQEAPQNIAGSCVTFSLRTLRSEKSTSEIPENLRIAFLEHELCHLFFNIFFTEHLWESPARDHPISWDYITAGNSGPNGCTSSWYHGEKVMEDPTFLGCNFSCGSGFSFFVFVLISCSFCFKDWHFCWIRYFVFCWLQLRKTDSTAFFFFFSYRNGTKITMKEQKTSHPSWDPSQLTFQCHAWPHLLVATGDQGPGSAPWLPLYWCSSCCRNMPGVCLQFFFRSMHDKQAEKPTLNNKKLH